MGDQTIQRCENCQFIRLAEGVEGTLKLRFATCKASVNQPLSRISEEFQNDEYLCTSERTADTCEKYLEQEHETT